MSAVRATLLLILIFLSCNSLRAQVDNVNPKVNIIGGETYYLHKVKSGQQIEAIAKAYYTEAKIISDANPDVVKGLTPGMELRIPCSFESYDAMSKLKVKQQKAEPQLVESRPPEPVAPPTGTSKKQVTPLEEAVSLIDSEKPREEEPEITEESEPIVEEPISYPVATPVAQVAEEEQEPADLVNEEAELEDLSKSITESLEALKKIREQLEAPVEEEAPKDDMPDIPASDRLSELLFLEQVMGDFFAPDSSDTALHIKEYFFVTADAAGNPTELKDERTETNENTNIIELDALKGIRFDGVKEAGLTGSPQPIGLNLDASKYAYSLKIKKKRIRYYRTSFFVEHMKSDHPHFDLIRKAADSEGKRGRCELIIYDGTMSASLHKAFEYNPFAEKDKTLKEQRFIEIQHMEFE